MTEVIMKTNEKQEVEEFVQKHPQDPYDHCHECPIQCPVMGKFQRVPRWEGGLGACRLLGR